MQPERRKRGRPAKRNPKRVTLATKVDEGVFALVCRRAKARHLSVSAYVRERLEA